MTKRLQLNIIETVNNEIKTVKENGMNPKCK